MTKPCLICIDVQEGFHEPYWGERNNPDVEEVIAKTIEMWRERSWPVIHVQHLSTDPESPLHPEKPGVEFMSCAMPLPQERIITKTVNSGFIGTDLETYLHEMGVDTAVLIGLTTNHCVSTTARMAANLGFITFVLSDATATFERTGPDGVTFSAETIHAVSLVNLHNEFAQVVTHRDILGCLG